MLGPSLDTGRHPCTNLRQSLTERRRPSDADPPDGLATNTPLTCDDEPVVTPPAQNDDPARIAERVGESLTRLARVTGELSTADSVDSVVKIVTYHMADAVGATIAAIALREGDRARIVGLRGLPAREAEKWELVPLSRSMATTDVIRSGHRLVLVGADAIARAYPDLPGIDRGERTVVTLPLRAGGRTIGAIHLSLPGRFTPDPTELDFLDIMADTCAQAFERIEASGMARRQTARLQFLAEASIELASSLDLDVTINRVARLAVPTFADWCAIDVIRDGRVHRLAVAHVDPRKVELAVALQERWPPDPASPSGARAVALTGRPELIHEITDEMLVAGSRDPDQLRIARELQLRSALLVPLWVRGRVIGVISWVSTDEKRLYDEDDVRFAEHLARRAATAIDNSELYSQTRAAAEQLQRAVLPQALVGDDQWDVSCHYRPSGRTEVGGDFYDAFGLGAGRYVVFLGDVMGRGVAAAAAMAEVRAATRAFASIDPDPAFVLHRLDAMVGAYGSDQLVTLVYVLADATAGHLMVGNAGHPPPSVLRADGSVEQLPFADGPPLGVPAGDRAKVTVGFGVGDTLLAFTDGLIERRDEDIDTGLERLAEAVPALAADPLVTGVERVVEAMRDDTYDDDMAALGLRRLA
jgi:serine phosphatase RsbU (regulator of sigma subunit)